MAALESGLPHLCSSRSNTHKARRQQIISSIPSRDSTDYISQSSSVVKFNCLPKSTWNNGSLRASNLSLLCDKEFLAKGSKSYVGECSYDGSSSDTSSSVAHEKVGVLLLNLGGPDTLQDVQPFLFNLFADPDIIRLPRPFRFLQRPLAQLISVLRAPKSKEGYASIGGGSPLRKITNEQAHALKSALEFKNVLANVYVAMRYWYPFTEEAVDQIKRDRISRLVVLPLYPQFSISTSGSSTRLLQGLLRKDSYLGSLPISIIESWYQRTGYIKSMADLIEGAARICRAGRGFDILQCTRGAR